MPFNCIYVLLQIDQPPPVTKVIKPQKPRRTKRVPKTSQDTRNPSKNITDALLKEVLSKEPDRIKVLQLILSRTKISPQFVIDEKVKEKCANMAEHCMLDDNPTGFFKCTLCEELGFSKKLFKLGWPHVRKSSINKHVSSHNK